MSTRAKIRKGNGDQGARADAIPEMELESRLPAGSALLPNARIQTRR
jgi:hypothetical protein